jgi:hypothetical protein
MLKVTFNKLPRDLNNLLITNINTDIKDIANLDAWKNEHNTIVNLIRNRFPKSDSTTLFSKVPNILSEAAAQDILKTLIKE